MLLICRILVQVMIVIQVCLKEIILAGKKSGCWGHEKQERGVEGGAVAKVGDKRQVSEMLLLY